VRAVAQTVLHFLCDFAYGGSNHTGKVQSLYGQHCRAFLTSYEPTEGAQNCKRGKECCNEKGKAIVGKVKRKV